MAGRPRLVWEHPQVRPSRRVAFAVETARAVIQDRLGAAEAAAALELQVEQVLAPLRNDRNEVTRAEASDVAALLRQLAEQVTDGAVGPGDDEHRMVIARSLGRLAEALR